MMKPLSFSMILIAAPLLLLCGQQCTAQTTAQTTTPFAPSAAQLEKLLKRFPAADLDQDGKLTIEEATQYRDKMLPAGGRAGDRSDVNQGAPRQFNVDAGWQLNRFPEHAVCYLTPEQIKTTFAATVKGQQPAVVSFDKPADGALRVVGTGHSFMAPGYRTLPIICKAAGMDQPLYTHTGGGITGSTRYKWEQENGIFEFEGRAVPKLLASISNANWDAMMWGPYFNDQPVYYSCWIDFCLQYNPEMKFYLSDAWPQLYQLEKNPTSEDFFTEELFDKLGAERRSEYVIQVRELLEKYPDKVYVMPTCDAMVLAAKSHLRGELPGIEGIHQVIGKKERSLWRDQLGHIGPGFEWLEGYVFYASLYGRSPELIEQETDLGSDKSFPSRQLDNKFREIAWQAVIEHPLSGITDENRDGIND